MRYASFVAPRRWASRSRRSASWYGSARARGRAVRRPSCARQWSRSSTVSTRRCATFADSAPSSRGWSLRATPPARRNRSAPATPFHLARARHPCHLARARQPTARWLTRWIRMRLRPALAGQRSKALPLVRRSRDTGRDRRITSRSNPFHTQRGEGGPDDHAQFVLRRRLRRRHAVPAWLLQLTHATPNAVLWPLLMLWSGHGASADRGGGAQAARQASASPRG